MSEANFREKIALGKTGLMSSRMGLGASYGLDGTGVEKAFERGINYLYWGTMRSPDFGAGIRTLARTHRADMIIVIQSYSRSASMLKTSLEEALSKLKIEYADFLLLGLWNKPPPARILNAALELKAQGKARHLMISAHQRKVFQKHILKSDYEAIMLRYNSAHRGAEKEVFPFLKENPPGVVAYTTTRWGTLLNPSQMPKGEAVPRASDCYRFALSAAPVSVCLSGPQNDKELEEAFVAMERGPMDPDEMAWMQRVGDHVYRTSPLSAGGVRRRILSLGARVWRRFIKRSNSKSSST